MKKINIGVIRMNGTWPNPIFPKSLIEPCICTRLYSVMNSYWRIFWYFFLMFIIWEEYFISSLKTARANHYWGPHDSFATHSPCFPYSDKRSGQIVTYIFSWSGKLLVIYHPSAPNICSQNTLWHISVSLGIRKIYLTTCFTLLSQTGLP